MIGSRLLASPMRLAIALGALLATGGCYEGYYDGGYGYGSAGYADYGATYPYGGWGAPGYGWSGGYYYPGAGVYVYDRGGRRHRWADGGRGWRGRDGSIGRGWRGSRRDGIAGRPDWQRHGGVGEGGWHGGRGGRRGPDGPSIAPARPPAIGAAAPQRDGPRFRGAFGRFGGSSAGGRGLSGPRSGRR